MPDSPTIVSLIASATEIVCALGLRRNLIGVSHECDYPEDVKGLPTLSRPKLDPKQPGHEIDRRVRELVGDGLSVYAVDVETLQRLAPDLIITQDHCEVCAVSSKDLEAATCSVTLKDTAICSLHPSSLEQVCLDFQRVANAAGVSTRGHELVRAFRQRLDVLRQQTGAIRPKPRVACLEWLQPPMLAAGWVAELVEIAGGQPIVVDEQRSFSTVTWEQVGELDPDVVVVMPCGYPIEHSLVDLGDSTLQMNLRRLCATATGRLYIADGNAYFNRPGPRLADSAEILAALIHQDRFHELRSHHVQAFTTCCD